MKRAFLTTLMVIVMIASVSFAACAEESEETPSQTALSLVTGNVGGGLYVAGVGLGEILNRYAPNIIVTAEASSGSIRNIELMEGGFAELALLSSIDVYESTHGVAPRFEENLAYSVIMPGHLSVFNRIVRADSDIETLADLKGSGAKIWNYTMTRKYGGVYLADLDNLQKYYDFTDDDITCVSYYTLGDQIDAIKESRHDLISYTTGVPNPTLTDLTTTLDCRFISIEEDILAQMCVDTPFFFPYVMEAGVYKGQDEPLNMVAYTYFLVVKNELDTDLVYELVKALCENYDDLAAIHPSLEDYSTDYLLRNTVAPWHPGAIKYFEEEGVWTSELAALQTELLAEVG